MPGLIAPLRANWRRIVVIHLFFTLLGVALLTPLFGFLVRSAVAMTGSAAVADQDIALLLLSPLGLTVAITLVAIFLAISALELGALQMLACAAQRDSTVPATAAIQHTLRNAPSLLRLTLSLTLRVLVYLVPYLLLIGAVAWWLLADHDINYYLSRRPPEFVVALVVGVVLTAALLVLLGRRLLDWSLVLPLVLVAGESPRAAFAASEAITRGKRGMCLRTLLSWLLLAVSLSLVPLLFLAVTNAGLIGAGVSHLPTLVALLGLAALVWTLLNVLVAAINMAGFTMAVARLFAQLAPSAQQQDVATLLAATGAEPTGRRWLPGTALLLAGLAVFSVGAGLLLLRGVDINRDVAVVAHRGAAGAAPENTLAAVRQALDDGADWVEIDVQETRDGEVVVVHDSDFMKLAGNPLKVWEGDLASVQQIDIGSWFDPRFSAERVPKLAEVLETVRGRSRLLIELKYYGHDEALEQRVVDIVEAANMTDEVAVMSLKLSGVEKLQAIRPQWTAGVLAAKSIGDLSRVDVDFLAVNQGMATTAFVRRAHKAGKQVFVWTVNDGLSMAKWATRGVDGVITDEPALAREVLAQLAELSAPERLVLSAALFFGKPQVAKRYRDDSP
ncbi:glycerophosphodiester phosphodiesterase [Pseudohalioglobus sediminis]|uniref:Glycerophosphodiester phosphodiesterase n=1 Tax=Pseudohalioglobus sediminis TaxID=2606449 RepID=A0A5B0WQN9_9GAMM|nr:glycerophosphodiester phosphodiesterase family protein [Pseudohalioglobus sediminis]KAA1189116.1 glycerophosphodiester phosphodiesterase [Pseudohalioglobus sediminis]